MIVLLMMIGVGFALGKVKFMDEGMNASLSKLVSDILQAGLVLSGLLNADPSIGKLRALQYIGMSFVMYSFVFALSFVTPRLLLADKSERGTYRFMTAFGNVSFMGFPVAMTLFKDNGQFYASMFNFPFSFLIFSVGVVMITGKKKYLNPRLLLSPPFIASVIGMIMFFIGLRVPEPVYRGIKTIGDAAVPLGMMIIGSSLSRIPFGRIFGDIRAYAYCVIKLLIIPVAAWFVFHFFVTDPIILGMMIVMTSMPGASITTMFSIRYGGNETAATRAVLLSTLFSAVTIPLVVSLLL